MIVAVLAFPCANGVSDSTGGQFLRSDGITQGGIIKFAHFGRKVEQDANGLPLAEVFDFKQVVTRVQFQAGVFLAFDDDVFVEQDACGFVSGGTADAVPRFLWHMQATNPIGSELFGRDAVEIVGNVVDGDVIHVLLRHGLARALLVDVVGGVALGRDDATGVQDVAPGVAGFGVGSKGVIGGFCCFRCRSNG